MRGLIEKDLRLTVVRKQTITIFLFVALVMGVSMNGTFLIAYLTMLAMIVGTGSMSYDEFDNGFPFLMTLPFDRKTYVKEKYLFSLIIVGVAWSFGVVVFAIIDVVKNNGAGLSEIPMMTAVIPSMYIATAIIVPLQLKFGAEKRRLAFVIVFGAITALIIGSNRILDYSINPFVIIINTLHNLPGAITVLILIGVCAIVTAISYICSVKIIERKEF